MSQYSLSLMKSVQSFTQPHQWIFLILACAIGIACNHSNDEDFVLPDTVDFNYHIRPILSQNCYLCHGPDPSSREANLRLDIYEGATATVDGGNIITPHNASRSLLIDRITSEDEDFQMPPPASKKNLSKKEIALIEKWINQGAEWKEHWAFIKPDIDNSVSDKFTNLNQGIDHFVDKELQNQKLYSAESASTNQLIRRVSYIVTGLPPSLEEIERFSNESEGSYQSMVDYYLNSPRFGERWARHWMDLVRYAEYMGHEFDFTINGATHYRDYLIRAFNDDVPYDQFVKEHLAGDMLEAPRFNEEMGFNESIIATAYANLGEGKHSPVSIKEEEASRIDNMIDVTSKTFQALTVSCARCHDHKFDPIPTSDYYAMYGMFESTRIGPTALTNNNLANQTKKKILDLKQAAKKALQATLSQSSAPLSLSERDGIQDFIESQKKHAPPNQLKFIGDFRNGSWNEWNTNGVAFGSQPLNGEVMLRSNKKGIQLALPSASSRFFEKEVAGSIRSPNFIIGHDSIGVYAMGKNSSVRVIVDNFQLIQNPLYGGLSRKINSEDFELYNLDVSMVKGHKAYIEILPGFYERHKYHLDSSAFVDVQYVFAYNPSEPIVINEFESQKKSKLISIDNQKEAIRAWSKNEASSEDIKIINALLPKIKNKQSYRNATKLLNEISELGQFLKGYPLVHTMSEGDAIMSPVFIRGSYKQLDSAKVAHGFLSAPKVEIAEFPQNGSGRLAWAEAVLHPDNPLTSRVIVNRIWHHIFGRGIVETVDNFGLQGKLPTHPQLLDYLAIRFMDEGWSVKNLIKEILLTNTFRKSTIPNTKNNGIDPENHFLHHFPIRRLEAEAIRDGILASSQELDTTMYGTPVAIHLTPFMTGRGKPKESGPLDGNGRRSIYTAIRRNFLPPMMLTFDMPIPFSSFGKRNITNVPAQSLALMNDPFVQEQAERWAEKILKEEKEVTNLEDRIEGIYLTAFARKPSKLETEEALQLLQDLSNNELSQAEMIDSLELWTNFCHTIYNLKEYIHLM